jgi:titin
MPVPKKILHISIRNGSFLFLICLYFNWITPLSAATFNVTNTLNSGAGSFRQAILNANTNLGSHIIAFKIPGLGPFTLNVTNALPVITNVVTIDGTTETNFNPVTALPIVELNGLRAGANATGLDLQSSNCVIRGLALNRFPGVAIYLEGAGGHTIQGNFIGTGIFGTNSLANSTNNSGGILIVSPNNLVGGTDPTNRNVISANGYAQIYLNGSSATGNQIQGNLIGPDVTGTKRFTNAANGIIFDGGAIGNTVGGAVAGAGNLISGNSESGIYINSGNGNTIQGNLIGLNLSGTAALSNSWDGITIAAGTGTAQNTLIGGTNAAARNIISGNATNGITVTGGGYSTGTLIQGNYIGLSSNGQAKIANGLNGVTIINSIGSTVGGAVPGAGNVISGNAYHGIYVGTVYAQGIAIQNNLIGVDATGTNAIGNGQIGVWLTGSANIANNTVGPGNVISGNGQEGVRLDSGAKANLVQGNFIGTDITGQRPLGNTQNGVRIESQGNTIGGLTTAARNLISGNTNFGIYLNGPGTSNTLVQGNFIGTDVTGTFALSNAFGGIALIGAPANTIGGTNAAARNLISGNWLNGIFVLSNSAAGNVIQGNYIGSDVTGTAAIPNGNGLTGNGGGGIEISGAPATLIGGPIAGAGNLISGNRWDAIAIADPGASNNVVQGNLVGVKADGVSPLGNDWAGVEIINAGGSFTTIGGVQPGAGNVFANAVLVSRCGIRIPNSFGPAATNVLVRGNSIYNNGGSGGFGIYLGSFLSAITPNDACDTDTGANQLQNYPLLANAFSDGKTTSLTGTLNSTVNSTFLLQFYATTAPVAGNVQGQTFLGDLIITNTAVCSDTSFTFRLPNALSAGQLITATATDAANNTSEFSPAVAILPPPNLNGVNSFAGGNPQITLAWSTNNLAAPTFTMLQATNLTPPVVWTPVTNLPALVTTNYTVTLTATNGQRYYRLSL